MTKERKNPNIVRLFTLAPYMPNKKEILFSFMHVRKKREFYSCWEALGKGSWHEKEEESPSLGKRKI